MMIYTPLVMTSIQMNQDLSSDLVASVEASFAEGMLGKEYDFVGVFSDRPEDQSDDIEIFIVAANSEV